MDLARTSLGPALSMALVFGGLPYLLIELMSDVWPESNRHGQ